MERQKDRGRARKSLKICSNKPCAGRCVAFRIAGELGCVCMQPHVMQTQSRSEGELAQTDSDSGWELASHVNSLAFSAGAGSACPSSSQGLTDRDTPRGGTWALSCAFPHTSWGFSSRSLRKLSGGKCLKPPQGVLRPCPSPRTEQAAHLPAGVTRGKDGTTHSTRCASWQ